MLRRLFTVASAASLVLPLGGCRAPSPCPVAAPRPTTPVRPGAARAGVRAVGTGDARGRPAVFRATNVSADPVYHDGFPGRLMNGDAADRVGGAWVRRPGHQCVVFGSKAELQPGASAVCQVYLESGADAVRYGCEFWAGRDWTGGTAGLPTVVWSDVAEGGADGTP